VLDEYILNGHTPVPAKSAEEWARWFQIRDRKVAESEANGLRVSTVFLGLDHRFGPVGAPILFETMVFPKYGYGELYCERYCTWDEAEAGHKSVVDRIQKGETFNESI
jgi:hypothetical protein